MTYSFAYSFFGFSGSIELNLLALGIMAAITIFGWIYAESIGRLIGRNVQTPKRTIILIAVEALVGIVMCVVIYYFFAESVLASIFGLLFFYHTYKNMTKGLFYELEYAQAMRRAQYDQAA